MPLNAPQPVSPEAAVFELAQLERQQQESGAPAYLEFLRGPALSLGLYHLPAGAEDRQQPHGEDEVYVVLSGRGRLRAGEQDHRIGPGSLAFVRARVPHRFHSIEEDLSLLVFFAPAESGG